MKKVFLLILLSSICFGQSFAQRKKAKKPVKQEVVEPEKTPEEKLFNELLPSTAQIMFIDSVVVDKASFLAQLPLSSDMGRMITDGTTVGYINEFGDTQIFAMGDSAEVRHLYISYKHGPKWEEARLIEELDNYNPSCPFLMSNGVTLYFSAEGEGTVGGKDIFMTSFNSDDSEFYEATNLGLPFNSPANEYFLAISDYDNLGWLVSDRYQPEDKVCIYTFEPTAQRKTFKDDTDEDVLLSYASISQIKDSWKFGDRTAALARLGEMAQRMAKKFDGEKVEFVVNDTKTITSLDGFKNAENKALYSEIAESKKKLASLEQVLESARATFSNTAKNKQHKIGREIIDLENEVMNLSRDIKNAEKQLRNAENK